MAKITRIIGRGLAVGLPIILTIALIVWLVQTLENWLGAPLKWLLGGAYLPGMGLIIGLGLLIALGLFASTWIGGRLLDWLGGLVERLPLVKTVYGAIKDVMAMFNQSKAQKLDKAVVVTWGEQRFLGFITREDAKGLPDGLLNEGDVVVYIPMGYQIGGFPILVNRKNVTPINMSVEAALKFALTAGVSATPNGK